MVRFQMNYAWSKFCIKLHFLKVEAFSFRRKTVQSWASWLAVYAWLEHNNQCYKDDVVYSFNLMAVCSYAKQKIHKKLFCKTKCRVSKCVVSLTLNAESANGA